MQTKFKRHQKVRLLVDPDPEYIEYYEEKKSIKKGALGKINMLLSNGQYHVEIIDKDGNELAYVKVSEEDLEAID